MNFNVFLQFNFSDYCVYMEYGWLCVFKYFRRLYIKSGKIEINNSLHILITN